METLKYFSTFSGIGGFELGIQQAYESNNEHAHIGEESEQKERPQGRVGATDKHEILLHPRDRTAPLCVGFSEIDKYAIQVYQRRFPNHKNYGDITKISERDLPDFDLFVGGFPCQPFSIAGRRGGFDDTRGTLFHDIARIIRAKQPRLLLLENVKGLLSHDKGRTFHTIITALDELGYDLQWQVLNSKNHGVPQNRERVYIAGHLRGTPRPEVFPIGASNKKHIREADEQGCSNTLTGRSAGGGNRRGNYIIHNIYGGFKEGLREFHDHSPTIRTAAGGGHIPNVVEGRKIRRLTPTECERLQGFPDGWTKQGIVMREFHDAGKGIRQNYTVVDISDTQRYKMCGNAVTTNVVRDVIKRMI
jgi:DNA (cytosine-5)-methyltransferase 1